MTQNTALIPTNIITGFLGVGKTTAINALLANKPEGENWAVLVNEFGQIGIDQEMLPDKNGLFVKELAGGCICCALGASLGKTVRALIEQAKLDRLIIEPTGIGHPEGIIDTLSGPAFHGKLDLRATVCLLDPRSLGEPEVINNETFHDQLNLADVVLINKCDLASEAQLTATEDSLNAMFPPKQFIGRTTRGAFNTDLLDVVRNGELKAQFPESHQHHQHNHAHSHEHNEHSHEPNKNSHEPSGSSHELRENSHSHDANSDIATPGKPLRKTGNGNGLYSCGWVFHRNDCFDYWQLETVLNGLKHISRIKGVIKIGNVWVFYNRVKDEHDFDKVAYRRDSRIEIISTEPLNWAQIENEMLKCLLVSSASE